MWLKTNKQINEFSIENENKIENDDDIIYNPYREDFIPDSEDSKKSKNKDNNNINNLMKISELPLNNKIEQQNPDEYNILKTYRSFGSDDFRLSSIESQNPLNRKKIPTAFNSEIFDNDDDNNEKKEENIDNNIDYDEEEDNSSVIQNPPRDDI